MLTAGYKLRALRKSLRLTLRDVVDASYELALQRGRRELRLAVSSLSRTEIEGAVPSIYSLYALSVTYNVDFHTLLRWYGLRIRRNRRRR